MRILKHVDNNLFKIICGEMLNIETSTIFYSNGQRTFTDSTVPEQFRGYPRIIDGNIIKTVTAVAGYIFVPNDVNLLDFEEYLRTTIISMEHELNDFNVLHEYHTIQCGYNTSVKLKSSCNLTRGATTYGKQTVKKNNGNTKRQFNVTIGDTRKGRFIWYIRHIRDFNYEITSENIEDAISQHISSIFYDRDNICNLDNLATTFEFSKKCLRGFSALTDQQITIFKYSDNPLLFELSDHWRNNPCILRDIDSSRVYEIDYHLVQLRRVNLGVPDNNSTSSTEVCTKCKSVLWGDNYVLAGSIKDPDSEFCSAICPICLHSSPINKPIEAKYFRVFRVKFPRTLNDMMEDNDPRKELRQEVLKGYKENEMISKGIVIKYIEIGEKYVSFSNIDDFLFTELALNPIFSGRKVCQANLLG